MRIRPYCPDDCPKLIHLFKDTIHRVNAKDYTPEQIAVWADAPIDLNKWNERFEHSHTLVAVIDNEIAGFANMEESGYLDCLYVHADHQRKGIASTLCDALEASCQASAFITEASITASSFFLKRGYDILKKQTVVRSGIELTNFVMCKSASNS